MGDTWRPAWSLDVLRNQINAAFPNRSRISDGFIGDANHRNTTSDHNPWYGPGIVTAGDFTHDPRAGFDIDRFTDELVATRDARIKFIIANSYIADSRPQFGTPFAWKRYYGSNPHTSHVHISVIASPICDSRATWAIPMLGGYGPTPTPNPAPVPSVPAFPFVDRNHYFGDIKGPERSHGGHYEHERPWVPLIQSALVRKGYARWMNGTQVAGSGTGWVDGIYGPETIDAVTRWQRDHMPHTTFWGQVWWDDWAALLK